MEVRPVYRGPGSSAGAQDFAAEIAGIDLSQPIDDATVRAIWDAIDRYAVLVFHDQRLTDAQLRDFAAAFGPLEIGRGALQGGRRRLAIPQIGDISNLDEDNQVRGREDRRRLDSLGNRLWHTDASYMPVPVVLGMLHAVAVPPPCALGGGETEFADMRAAYDALPEATQAEIDGLVVEHDIFWSRGQIGFTDVPAGRAGEISALAATPGAPASGIEAEDAVSVGACLAYRRLAGRRRAVAVARPERARDAASVRLQPPMARGRPGDLGQSLHDASRPAARRDAAARPAAGDDIGYKFDAGASGIGDCAGCKRGPVLLYWR